MDTFLKIAEKASMPLGFMAMIFWVLAGFWLILLGEWGQIAYGVFVMFISIFGLVSALMLGMFFAGPATAFGKKGKKAGYYIFSTLSALYSMTVLSAWCIAVLYLFTKGAGNHSIIPTLLWAYGVAIFPVLWISQKDLQSGDPYALISTFSAELASLLFTFTSLFIRLPLAAVIVIFSLVMIAGIIFQFRVAAREMKAQIGTAAGN